jgi:hypothetical protein
MTGSCHIPSPAFASSAPVLPGPLFSCVSAIFQPNPSALISRQAPFAQSIETRNCFECGHGKAIGAEFNRCPLFHVFLPFTHLSCLTVRENTIP